MVCGLQYSFLMTAMTFESRSNILTISLWLVTRTPLSFIEYGCFFLAQLLLMVCSLHKKLQITAMTLETKVNKNMSYTFMF